MLRKKDSQLNKLYQYNLPIAMRVGASDAVLSVSVLGAMLYTTNINRNRYALLARFIINHLNTIIINEVYPDTHKILTPTLTTVQTNDYYYDIKQAVGGYNSISRFIMFALIGTNCKFKVNELNEIMKRMTASS